MNIGADYRGLIDALAAALPPVDAVGLYLPEFVNDDAYRDEFGFVFLEDGSVGPFYVSLSPVLETLLERFPSREPVRFDPVVAARGLAGDDLAERALALGAFNALSQRLLRLARYEPPERGSAKEAPASAAGSAVGMVGYFCPVIDRLVAAGYEVLVLERQPGRVVERPGVRLVHRADELATCGLVLCTASVLVNDSLDEVLAGCRGCGSFELIGPSGSGLPDVLFARGVDAVGGVSFEDPDRLRTVLRSRGSWGEAGRKYRIRREDYPGLHRLLADCPV